MLRKAAGIHMVTVNQDESLLSFYIDGELIATKDTGLSTLTLGSILSQYTGVASLGVIRYFDARVYDRSFGTDDLEIIQSSFESLYPDHKREDAPVISNYSTSGISNGATLNPGDTITVSYDITNGTASKIAVLWLTGGGTMNGFSVHDSATSIIIPDHSDIAKTDVWIEMYVIDSNGRASNSLIDDVIRFTITPA